ncbi:MAG: TlpA family protein disulfide reductase [Bdellovibrionales bacterium]|nr:TlpA family protein disulfide reductase [Bdellovibrionales bacterium]
MLKTVVLFLFIIIGILGLDSAGVLPLGWVKSNSSKSSYSSINKINNEKLFFNLHNLSLMSLNGKKFLLKDFKNKVVVINFWASWCEPCKEEFPAILKLSKKFKKKLVVIAISSDFSKNKAVTFLQNFKKIYPHSFKFVYGVWDKNSKITQKIFKIIKLPETLILDKNLKVVTKIIGTKKWLNGEAYELIKKLL